MVRISRQRQEILRVLSRKDYHPTAEEIFERVRRRLPETGIATIYRNLLSLVEEGSVVKLDRGMKSARYDGNTEPHAHAVCSECGGTWDVFLRGGIDLEDEVRAALPGFRMTSSSIEMEGVCCSCDGGD